MSNRRGRGNRNKKISIDSRTLRNLMIILVLLIVLCLCAMGIIKLLQRDNKGEQAETLQSEGKSSTEAYFQDALNEFTELENYKPDSLIRISAVGSIMAGENTINSGKPYNNIFDNITQYIYNTDLTLGTYETDTRGEKQEFAKYVRQAGINYVSLAHNHALDYENEGLRETNNYLNSIGIQTVGIDEGVPQDRVKIFEKKNVKIAILAYTYDNKKEGVSIYTEDRAREDLDYAEKMADVSIVMMHWGDTYSYHVTDEQEKQAKFLVDHGADVIIGSHPAVVQRVEMVKNSFGDDCLVAYSLGNFTSELKDEDSRLEMILDFQIFMGEDGKAKIQKPNKTPIYMVDNGNQYTENRYKLLDPKYEITAYEAEDSKITKTLYNKLKNAVQEFEKIVDSSGNN